MRFIVLGLALLGLGGSNALAANLAGSEWGFEDSDKRFIQFMADGKVSGHGGCNRFFGNYHSETDNKLHFSNIASTRKACPDPEMKLEMEFFEILAKAGGMKIERYSLSIFDENGALIAELVRKDWD